MKSLGFGLVGITWMAVILHLAHAGKEDFLKEFKKGSDVVTNNMQSCMKACSDLKGNGTYNEKGNQKVDGVEVWLIECINRENNLPNVLIVAFHPQTVYYFINVSNGAYTAGERVYYTPGVSSDGGASTTHDV